MTSRTRTPRLHHSCPLSRRLGAALATTLVLAPLAAHADCSTMLAPVFTAAKQYGQNTDFRISLTVTKLYAGSFGTVNAWQDPVKYSNGIVHYSVHQWPGGAADTLGGTIETRLNTAAFGNTDMFAPSGAGLAIAVNSSGQVSVQELINGQPIGGFPARLFGATCTAGVLTFIDSANAAAASGGAAWAIGITSQYIPLK